MIRTFMKTAIALGLFSLAPLMNNVYAQSCTDNCQTTVNSCIAKCDKYKNDPTDFRPCLGACQTSFSACLGTCKGK